MDKSSGELVPRPRREADISLPTEVSLLVVMRSNTIARLQVFQREFAAQTAHLAAIQTNRHRSTARKNLIGLAKAIRDEQTTAVELAEKLLTIQQARGIDIGIAETPKKTDADVRDSDEEPEGPKSFPFKRLGVAL